MKLQSPGWLGSRPLHMGFGGFGDVTLPNGQVLTAADAVAYLETVGQLSPADAAAVVAGANGDNPGAIIGQIQSGVPTYTAITNTRDAAAASGDSGSGSSASGDATATTTPAQFVTWLTGRGLTSASAQAIANLASVNNYSPDQAKAYVAQGAPLSVALANIGIPANLIVAQPATAIVTPPVASPTSSGAAAPPPVTNAPAADPFDPTGMFNWLTAGQGLTASSANAIINSPMNKTALYAAVTKSDKSLAQAITAQGLKPASYLAFAVLPPDSGGSGSGTSAGGGGSGSTGTGAGSGPGAGFATATIFGFPAPIVLIGGGVLALLLLRKS